MKYEVTITEAFAHRLIVSASTEEGAYEKALWLVSNTADKYLEKEYDYKLEPVGYDGYWSAEEVTK